MIQMNDIEFKYARQSKLFSQLSWRLNQGGIYGLLGKNGAGKTTLLKLIAGLIFPKKGKCHVMDFTPSKRNPFYLQELFLIPEEFELPKLRINQYEQLYAPFYPNFDQGDFYQLINEFDLDHGEKIHSLSFGQSKKVLIAFGIATNTRLLIMDEPTNGLDIPSKSQFRKLMASRINENRTYIISTHQVKDIEKLVDAIVVLEEGKIIFQQSLFEITEALTFNFEQIEPKDTIHHENELGGFVTLRKNETDSETDINLELLFNALTLNPAEVNKCFPGGQNG
jgi:ABC-2 type transport system ATP-binding protein